MDDLLTPQEHRLLRKLGECVTLYHDVSRHDGVHVVQNRNEFAASMHVLQNMVLARAAARLHPLSYRL